MAEQLSKLGDPRCDKYDGGGEGETWDCEPGPFEWSVVVTPHPRPHTSPGFFPPGSSFFGGNKVTF